MELLDKATEQQKLKVMLLKGTREQVFSAAKHAGIIASNVVESDANYEKLRNVIDTMEELRGN